MGRHEAGTRRVELVEVTADSKTYEVRQHVDPPGFEELRKLMMWPNPHLGDNDPASYCVAVSPETYDIVKFAQSEMKAGPHYMGPSLDKLFGAQRDRHQWLLHTVGPIARALLALPRPRRLGSRADRGRQWLST